MKSKQLSRGDFISLSQFHFLRFLQYGAISHFFYNIEYIIISSLTNGLTDMGICFFQKHSINMIRLRKKTVLSLFY